ncbi:hypothetical protein HX049_06630 [Myroides odoratimimus]|uniref:DUF6660 family protein n=1 Tax=Myroides odoratimimus TaxID=76832 RepID=UPI002575E7A4|nr:DUF6660 family protein [Myroides odoratimimus]MDM1396846.1 hypothetical protein [Myroides odoratimimus]
MKQFKSILNLFLSLIFLAISFYPCADSYAAVPMSQNTESIHLTSVAQTDLDIDHDACSPLCSCSCCAVSLTLAEVIDVIELLPSKDNHKDPINHKDSVIKMEYPIWQPPKIVA